MTPPRKRIVKPLVRKNHCSVVKQCLKNDRLRSLVINGIGIKLHKEVATLCSDASLSILRDKSMQALETFTWDHIYDEMRTRSPTSLSLLEWCTKIKKPKKNKRSIITFVAAILCRLHRPSSSLVQRLISLILSSGHAAKSVSNHMDCLQKL